MSLMLGGKSTLHVLLGIGLAGFFGVIKGLLGQRLPGFQGGTKNYRNYHQGVAMRLKNSDGCWAVFPHSRILEYARHPRCRALGCFWDFCCARMVLSGRATAAETLRPSRT